MKALFDKIFIISILMIGFSPTTYAAPTAMESWTQSIEDPNLGYRGWIHGISTPTEAEAAAAETGFDAKINAITAPIAAAVGKFVFFKVPFFGAQLPLVVLWLVIGAVFFTLYMGFINIRGFKHAIQLVKGDFSDPDAKSAGEVSHFQALATAVSGTVGIGNIGGVAVAVTIGGAGATFWMIMAGFLGMSTKFVECTLGVKYRKEFDDGHVSGGPMYYLRQGFAERGMTGFGKFMGTFYAIGIFIGALGIGNMFQSNQAYVQLNTVANGGLDGYGWLIGLIQAVVVFIVIIGGIKSIAKVTEKIVPFMAIFYCLFAIVVILMNFSSLPQAISNIITGAFTANGVAGGAIGALIIGFQRAVFSNEAGIGSASIAHSAVNTNYPASEGIVALLEPFIDTVVICTMTALVIIMFNFDGKFAYAAGNTSGVTIQGVQGLVGGVDLTSMAYDSVLPGFRYILTLAIVLFAFSTMISWSYYGLQAWKYLFGRSNAADISYKILFLIFVVIGAAASLGSVIKFSDAMIFAMVFPNMIGLFFLFPKVKEELNKYLEAIKGV